MNGISSKARLQLLAMLARLPLRLLLPLLHQRLRVVPKLQLRLHLRQLPRLVLLPRSLRPLPRLARPHQKPQAKSLPAPRLQALQMLARSLSTLLPL